MGEHKIENDGSYDDDEDNSSHQSQNAGNTSTNTATNRRKSSTDKRKKNTTIHTIQFQLGSEPMSKRELMKVNKKIALQSTLPEKSRKKGPRPASGKKSPQSDDSSVEKETQKLSKENKDGSSQSKHDASNLSIAIPTLQSSVSSTQVRVNNFSLSSSSSAPPATTSGIPNSATSPTSIPPKISIPNNQSSSSSPPITHTNTISNSNTNTSSINNSNPMGLIVTEDDSEISASCELLEDSSKSAVATAPGLTTSRSNKNNDNISPVQRRTSLDERQRKNSSRSNQSQAQQLQQQQQQSSGKTLKRKLHKKQKEPEAKQQMATTSSSSSLSQQAIENNSASNNIEVISTTNEAKQNSKSATNGHKNSSNNSTNNSSNNTANGSTNHNSHSNSSQSVTTGNSAAVVSLIPRKGSQSSQGQLSSSNNANTTTSSVAAGTPSASQQPQHVAILTPAIQAQQNSATIPTSPEIPQQQHSLIIQQFGDGTNNLQPQNSNNQLNKLNTNNSNSNGSSNIIYLHRKSIDEGGSVSVRALPAIVQPVKRETDLNTAIDSQPQHLNHASHTTPPLPQPNSSFGPIIQIKTPYSLNTPSSSTPSSAAALNSSNHQSSGSTSLLHSAHQATPIPVGPISTFAQHSQQTFPLPSTHNMINIPLRSSSPPAEDESSTNQIKSKKKKKAKLANKEEMKLANASSSIGEIPTSHHATAAAATAAPSSETHSSISLHHQSLPSLLIPSNQRNEGNPSSQHNPGATPPTLTVYSAQTPVATASITITTPTNVLQTPPDTNQLYQPQQQQQQQFIASSQQQSILPIQRTFENSTDQPLSYQQAGATGITITAGSVNPAYHLLLTPASQTEGQDVKSLRKLDESDYQMRMKRGPMNTKLYEDQSNLFQKLNDYQESIRRDREVQFEKYCDDLQLLAGTDDVSSTVFNSSTSKSNNSSHLPTHSLQVFPFSTTSANQSYLTSAGTTSTPPELKSERYASCSSSQLLSLSTLTPLLFRASAFTKEEQRSFHNNPSKNRMLNPISSQSVPSENDNNCSTETASAGNGEGATASTETKSRSWLKPIDSQILMEKSFILQDKILKKFKHSQHPDSFRDPFSQLHSDFAQTYLTPSYCKSVLSYFNINQQLNNKNVPAALLSSTTTNATTTDQSASSSSSSVHPQVDAIEIEY